MENMNPIERSARQGGIDRYRVAGGSPVDVGAWDADDKARVIRSC